jgi:hypothetical protein
MTAPLLVDETPAKSAFESETDESIESAAGVAHEIGTAAQLMVTDALVFSKGSLTGARVVTRAFAKMQAACPLRRVLS